MNTDQLQVQVLTAILQDSSATVSERLRAAEMLSQLTSSTLPEAAMRKDSTQDCPAHKPIIPPTDAETSKLENENGHAIAGDDPVVNMPKKQKDRSAMRLGRLRMP